MKVLKRGAITTRSKRILQLVYWKCSQEGKSKAGQPISHSTNQRGWFMVVVEVIRRSRILGLFWRWIICAELMDYVGRKERHNSLLLLYHPLFCRAFNLGVADTWKILRMYLVQSYLCQWLTEGACLNSPEYSIDMEFTSI